MSTFDLSSTFVVLDARHSATRVPVGPTLYQDLDRDFREFHHCLLVAEYAFDQDWPTWERHPAGDEVVYLLAGSAQIRVLEEGRERMVELRGPGASTIIPKGLWHTARVTEHARMLFITPGERTQNGPDPRTPVA